MDKTSRNAQVKRMHQSKVMKMSTPSNVEEIVIQNTVFDLDSMDEVLLKKVGTFVPPTSIEAALAALGNDSAKLLSVVADGMREHAKSSLKSDTSVAWKVEDEEGNTSDFNGSIADSAKVNGLILNMAKSVFGYTKDMAREAKRAAKESAMGLIKNTPAIRDGLKAQAATK